MADEARSLDLGRRQRLVAALGIAGIVAVLCGAASGARQMTGLNRLLTDGLFPTGEVDDRVAVVELRGEEIAWSRQEHARLVDALAEAGAAVIAYDVVFDDPGASGTPELAAAVARAGNVVLAASAGLAATDDVPRLTDVVQPLPQLEAAARYVAHAQSVASNVGQIFRFVPLVAEKPDRRYLPALSLAATTLLEGADPGAVTLRPDTGLNIGGRFVPTDPERLLVVNWAWTWSTNPDRLPDGLGLRPEDVFSGRADVAGKLVFVGASTTIDGCLDLRGEACADIKPTPVNKAGMPGVHIHASAANTLLTRLFRTNANPGWNLGGIAALAALVAGAGMAPRRLRWPSLLATALGAVVVWGLFVDWHFQWGRTLDVVWPTAAVLLSAVGVVLVRYLTEERERQRVAGMFRQYVPDAVVDDLIASGRATAAADGERVEVTVLFCDLRGFTATAATLPPADVRALLEVFYDHATRVIQDHGGTVMQFVGDEVFAVFGAPVPQPDHAQRALDAARAMQAANEAVNAELAPRGVSIAWGIGLNTGPVVAAHVGSQVHKQYAVVGQTVNVGARLCSQAAAGEVVFSKWTREALARDVAAELLGPVSLKGVKDDPEPARVLL